MENPYRPPSSSAPPGIPQAPVPQAKPRVISLLGWADLVFGSTGIISAIVTVAGFVMLQFHPQVDIIPGTTETTVKIAPEWQEAVTVTLSVLTSLLALIAGFRMVKCRRNAPGAANRFALASLSGKLANISIMPSLGFEKFSTHLRISSQENWVITFSGLIAGITIYFIYPILCLLLLNRRRVKDWLAVYGT